MRVLLIADASSIWTAKYVDRVLLPLGFEVVVLTSERPTRHFASVYAMANVTLRYQSEVPRWLGRAPGLRGIVKRARTASSLRRIGHFDVIHVQMVLLSPVKLAFRLRVPGSQVVLSYWGSDLMRRNRKQINAMRHYLRLADQVSVNSHGMQEAFRDNYGDLDVSPILLPFGVNGIEAIDAIGEAESRTSWCEAFGFPPNRIIVTIGYNGRPAQQHLEVLDTIQSLPENVRQRLHVVLPMTYAAKDAYCEEVSAAASRLGCGFSMLRDFLDEKQQARLCLATDLFINSQTTDALSAALQEFLYARAEVFSGSWLRYPELDEADVQLKEFDSLAELPDLLARFLADYSGHRSSDSVRSASIKSRSWTALAPKWASLYEYPVTASAPQGPSEVNLGSTHD